MGCGEALKSSRNESSVTGSPRGPGSEMALPLRKTVSAPACADSQSCWVISAPSGVNHAMSESSSWVPSTGRPWKKRRRRNTGWSRRSHTIDRVNSRIRRASSSDSSSSLPDGQLTQASSLSWQ